MDQGSNPLNYTMPTPIQNSQGYYNPIPLPNFGDDPYAFQATQLAPQIAGQTQAAQGQIAGLQGGMGAYGGTPASTAYPTYPNAAGVGSQAAGAAPILNTTVPMISPSSSPPIGATPGAASNPDFGSSPVTVNVPDTTTRGFNPWSLTGESNARGK